jgi:hypothetical protein
MSSSVLALLVVGGLSDLPTRLRRPRDPAGTLALLPRGRRGLSRGASAHVGDRTDPAPSMWSSVRKRARSRIALIGARALAVAPLG